MAHLLGLVDVLLANELDQHNQKVNLRRCQLMLRDTSDPFNMTDRRFLKLFRFNKEVTRILIDMIEPHILIPQKNWAVPNVLKILVSLHFFGHGSYQLDVGGVYNFGMSQPTVSRCIALIVDIINRHLIDVWINFPTVGKEIANKKQAFLEKYNFPNTLGAIDCTHIAIIAPPNDHPVYPAAPYFNRKGYHSINTQIICDADLIILSINARYPGSVHDQAIWNLSNIKNHLRTLFLSDTLNYHLIGDSGYSIQPWLMVPVPDAEEGTPDAFYNNRLTIARNAIERTNGVLKSRFRCLLKHRTLNYNPIKASQIIYACAVLHNVARHFKVSLPDNMETDANDNENHPSNNFRQDANNADNWMNRGQIIRNDFINRYFRNA